MKTVLQGELQISNLQTVQTPFELFHYMMGAKLLSEDNLDLLDELLRSIDRIDLSMVLLEEQVKPKLQVKGEEKYFF